jgi:hypothetical protein
MRFVALLYSSAWRNPQVASATWRSGRTAIMCAHHIISKHAMRKADDVTRATVSKPNVQACKYQLVEPSPLFI